MEPHARLLVHTSTGYTALAYRNLCLRLLCAMQVASASAKYKKAWQISKMSSQKKALEW